MKEHELSPGIRIQGFDSLEEMSQYMDAQEAEVASHLEDITEEQRQITFGSYALRLLPVGEPVESVLAIFGQVMDDYDFYLTEREAGASPREILRTMDKYLDLYDRGYRYGRWYSTVCPEGEVGDAHLITLWPITEADYQHALNNRWEIPAYLYHRVLNEMKNAIDRKKDSHE